MPTQRRVARRTGFTRGQRQPTNWARTVTADTTIAGGVSFLLTTVVLSNPGINETIRRTRGRIFIRSNDIATNDSLLGVFAAAVVTDRAIGVGAGSLPRPSTDASDDGWFVWLPLAWHGSIAIAGNGWQGFEFDSKAMRRVEEGYGIAFLVENVSADPIVVTGFISVLTSLS